MTPNVTRMLEIATFWIWPAVQSRPEPSGAAQSRPEPSGAVQSRPEPFEAVQSRSEPSSAVQSRPESRLRGPHSFPDCESSQTPWVRLSTVLVPGKIYSNVGGLPAFAAGWEKAYRHNSVR